MVSYARSISKSQKKVLLQVSNTTQEAELPFKDIKIAVGLNENCIDEIVKRKTDQIV